MTAITSHSEIALIYPDSEIKISYNDNTSAFDFSLFQNALSMRVSLLVIARGLFDLTKCQALVLKRNLEPGSSRKDACITLTECEIKLQTTESDQEQLSKHFKCMPKVEMCTLNLSAYTITFLKNTFTSFSIST